MKRGGAIVKPPRYKEERERGLGLGGPELALGAMLCVLVGATAATQVVAHSFGYHPNLGPPAVRLAPVEAWIGFAVTLAVAMIGVATRRGVGFVAVALGAAGVCFAAAQGPLYVPSEFFRWVRDYRAHPELIGILTRGWIALGLGASAAGLAAAGVLGQFAVKTVSTSHGSASWGSAIDHAMTPEEQLDLQWQREDGDPVTLRALVIGKIDVPPPWWAPWRPPEPRLLLHRGEGHLITTAMTRSGKGVGCVIPNTLFYAGSVLLVDLKAENFFVTHRKRVALGEVFVLDGFEVTTRMAGVGKKSEPYLCSSNPLDLIQVERDDAIDVARMIAGALILDEEGPNRHFSDEARGIFAGFLVYACFLYAQDPAKRTLPGIREMWSQGEEEFERLLNEMASSTCKYAKIAANELLQKEAKERSGVLSTINRYTRFLDSPAMERVLGYNPKRMFDISTIKGSRLTVYLVLPPDRLDEYAGWVRLMITCCNAAMVQPDVPPPRDPVLFMVDEAGQLGPMEPLKRTMTLLTGYGVRVWLIFQNVPQIKKLYPKDYEGFYGSADVRIMFGTADMTTGELVSKYAGETTIFVEGGNSGLSRGSGKQRSTQRSSGENTSEKGRKLLMPDEVTRLGRAQQLVFITGEAPLMVDKARYFELPQLADDHDANPLMKS
jgi:type IV secretion system protein VirD4